MLDCVLIHLEIDFNVYIRRKSKPFAQRVDHAPSQALKKLRILVLFLTFPKFPVIFNHKKHSNIRPVVVKSS